jgi:cephalosporin hydroxylase
LRAAAVEAPAGTRLTLTHGPESRTVDLYSRDGLQLVGSLWTKLSAEYRLMYEPTWLGVPIIQLPDDIVMMQELIWKVRPDVIVECGVAHGGSAILYASICSLMGKGRVIGIDVEIRPQNRAAVESHRLADRIQLIEGSSTAPEVVRSVRGFVADAATVLVALDSDHSRAHVRKELEAYAPLVTPGSYLVAMGGAQAFVADIPRGKPEWKYDSPLPAIEDFLGEHPEFAVDRSFERLIVTANPSGYLRRKLPEELRAA